MFLPFYGLICKNLEFLSVKSSKLLAHRILQDTNIKDEKSGVWKRKFTSSTARKKWSYRFPWKTSSD